MSEELRQQIRDHLKQKDIYELLDIWKTNNRIEWSDMAFEVLRELLKEKVREIPPQDDPILDSDELKEPDDKNHGLEEWEEKIIDSKKQPELYDPLQIMLLKRNIDRLMIAVVIVYILLEILNFQPARMYFQGVSVSINDIEITAFNIFTATISTALKIAFVYFPLKALSHILRILMEMEFNSRKR